MRVAPSISHGRVSRLSLHLDLHGHSSYFTCKNAASLHLTCDGCIFFSKSGETGGSDQQNQDNHLKCCMLLTEGRHALASPNAISHDGKAWLCLKWRRATLLKLSAEISNEVSGQAKCLACIAETAFMLWYVFADFACLQTVHSWEDKGCTHKATLPCMPKSRMQLRGCDKLVLLYFMGF